MVSCVKNPESDGGGFVKEKFISNSNEIKQKNNVIVSPGNYKAASFSRKDISAYFIFGFERSDHNYFPLPTKVFHFLAHIETPSFRVISKNFSFPYSF
jgi:hypothetical protein